jgi:hypothetical protein
LLLPATDVRSGDFEGEWWLPDDPSKRIAGILHVDPDDEAAELQLIGTLRDAEPIPAQLNASAKYPVMHGLVQAHLITLMGCEEAAATLSFPGFIAQRLHPDLIYFGGHLSSADPEVVQAWVQLTHLPQWLPVHRNIETGNGGMSVTVSYAASPEVVCSMPWGAVAFRTWPSSSTQVGSVSIRSAANVRITPAKTARLREFMGWFSALQNLLTLATDAPNAVEMVQLEVPESALLEQQGPRPYLELVYERVFRSPDPPDPPHPGTFLFQAADLEDICSAIGVWFELSSELDATLNLYFSTRYRPPGYVHARFLNAAQAAEVYHRRRLQGQVVTKDEHRARLKVITESVPVALVGWLKSALAFSNEKTLATRIDELVELRWDVMKGIIADRREFVRSIVGLRNYFTHWVKKDEFVPPPNSEVFLLAERLGVLVQACLLAELRIPVADQVRLFERNARFQWLSGTAGGPTELGSSEEKRT